MPVRAPALFPLLLVALALSPAAARPAAAEASTPESVVRQWTDALIGVMKEARALNVKGRYERLLPPVNEAFHLPVMVRSATGAHWANATPEQRNRLITAFTRMNVGTLATLFDDYSGETFRLKGPQPAPQGTVLFRTELVKASGSTVDIAYLMANFKSRWLIVDVVVDSGISELSVRRSEYNRILSQHGVEGLIAALDGKADELTTAEARAK
jgi:phospholipid transport system substrate-binding protein